METKVVEINSKERKPKTYNLNAKTSIRRYVSDSVEIYSSKILSEVDKDTIKNTLEEYVQEYIKDEAKRLTFNSKCIKTNRKDKIKVKANLIDVVYSTGFVLAFVWCLLDNLI